MGAGAGAGAAQEEATCPSGLCAWRHRAGQPSQAQNSPRTRQGPRIAELSPYVEEPACASTAWWRGNASHCQALV